MTTPRLSKRLFNRDVIVALFLLVVCAVLWAASLEIREPDYGQLSPATWPRIIIALMTLLSFIFLVQSVRAADSDTEQQPATDDSKESYPGFYQYWRNVIWCFVLFGLYLYLLPWLGMLVGASSFVFLLLCALGGWHPQKLLLHAAIALVTVGGMWSLFTFVLDVILPSGRLFENL